mmetsp:Transcript_11436/g.18615  ORF Transcript_11436/g.18615 Transcript_11436/m.18615 type:complete len:265 (-) Transcript_11436:1453-2247(-)
MERFCPVIVLRGGTAPKGSAGLVEDLKHASKDLHDVSDKLVLAKLAVSLKDKVLFARSLALFLVIFKEVDSLLTRAFKQGKLEACSGLEVFVEPLLASRIPAFHQDIETLGNGRVAPEDAYNNEAVQEYVKHLGRVAETNPVGLIAYFYHLSLALLAGGQSIKVMVKKAFPRDSVCVFDYPSVPPRWAMKKEFKAAVNGLELSETDRQALLTESVQCFRLNNSLVLSFNDANFFDVVVMVFQSLWLHSSICAVMIGCMIYSSMC